MKYAITDLNNETVLVADFTKEELEAYMRGLYTTSAAGLALIGHAVSVCETYVLEVL